MSALLDKKYLGERGIFNAIIQDPHITSAELEFWSAKFDVMGSNQKKQKEDMEDMGSLSSPGTDTSGKARDKKKMEFLPGKKVKGQA